MDAAATAVDAVAGVVVTVVVVAAGIVTGAAAPTGAAIAVVMGGTAVTAAASGVGATERHPVLADRNGGVCDEHALFFSVLGARLDTRPPVEAQAVTFSVLCGGCEGMPIIMPWMSSPSSRSGQ